MQIKVNRKTAKTFDLQIDMLTSKIRLMEQHQQQQLLSITV